MNVRTQELWKRIPLLLMNSSVLASHRNKTDNYSCKYSIKISYTQKIAISVEFLPVIPIQF